ncbi:MAG: ester cyclase [Actinomycetota bacterium]|nr:ester cyclase [Actinomycetota bacterium]
MTTPEQNMASCREFNERVFNDGDVSFAEKIMSDDFVDHSPPPGGTGDKASTITMFQQMHEQYPDAKAEILDMIAAGDKVAIRTRVSGTDTKGFMPGMTPTGKHYTMETIDVVTFDENGMNSERYGIADIAGAMMQLGLMPGPGGSA